MQVLLALICLLALTAANLVTPEIIRQVIDTGLEKQEAEFLGRSALLILLIGLINAGLVYTQRYLGEWIANHVGYDLRNRLYDHIQHLSFSFHDTTQTGQLISRCIEDARAIERFTGFGVIEIFRFILLTISISILLFIQQPKLAAIALIPMIPLVIITTDFGKRISKLFLAVDRALGDMSSQLQENVSGVQVVRAFAREEQEITRFAEKNQRVLRARLQVIRNWARILPTTQFLVAFGTILILWFGGSMVMNNEMTVGELVAFNSYLLLRSAPAQQLTWLVNAGGEAVAGVQRAFEIIDQPPEIASQPNAPQLPMLSGSVVFNDVSLSYQGQLTSALENINLEARPNQVIALLGPTGSGKSSLVNLIPRFYDVTGGTVLVDGYDVREIDLVSLRKQIGIVLQTSLLFSATIRENIAYGRPGASIDEIMAAAKAAQADEFINSLPNGYDTEVGERGVTLSGGQRQRIAIARALLMDPRILILDDSTSSVDTETEYLIQKALDQLMQNRTTFVIAHRLSTVRRADQILVMQNGRIVQRGKHQELLNEGGLYREIYELQMRDQESFRETMELIESQEKTAAPLRARGLE
jgi:ATP-binding cassette subfamily B protein